MQGASDSANTGVIRGAVSSGVAVGIDVGGTKIAAGLVAADGTLLSRERRDSPAQDSDAIVEAIAALARELCAEQDIAQAPVGVGAAGVVDTDGTVVYAPNLAWSGRPLRADLEARLGVPVAVVNDGIVAAWGEFRAGAARDVEGSIVMLTLGTGVGGGLVVDDRLSLGTHGMGAEFGHIIVCEGGLPCPCGNHGCLEAYASGTAIGTLARRRLEAGDVPGTSALHELDELTGKSVTIAAHGGDEAARSVVSTAGFWLGVGIASLVNALDPALVVIGGGAMQAGSLLLEPAREAAAQRLLGRHHRDLVPVVRATLGDDAGVIGAGLLALERAPIQRGAGAG